MSEATQETSLPLPTPDSRPFRLLDLPSEIVIKVLTHIFERWVDVEMVSASGEDAPTYSTRLAVAEPKYFLGLKGDCIDGDRHMPRYREMRPSGNLSLSKGSTTILQTSQLLYRLGSLVLYNMYTFRSFSAESFRIKFTKHIGLFNIYNIRSLIFGLPHALKCKTTTYLPKYLHLLSHQMPELSSFVLTTASGGWSVMEDPSDADIEKHRGLLLTSAYVTLRHGRLKFAVWEEKGTIIDGYFNLEAGQGRLSVHMSATPPENLTWYGNPETVSEYNERLQDRKSEIEDMIISYHSQLSDYDSIMTAYDEYVVRHELFELYAYDLDIEGEQYNWYGNVEEVDRPDILPPLPFVLSEAQQSIRRQDLLPLAPPQGLLLDSFRIRRAGFSGLGDRHTYRPWHWQAKTTSKGSEVSTPSDLFAADDQIISEELFLYNKNPELAFPGIPTHLSPHRLHLRARAAHHELARVEKLAYKGPTYSYDGWGQSPEFEEVPEGLSMDDTGEQNDGYDDEEHYATVSELGVDYSSFVDQLVDEAGNIFPSVSELGDEDTQARDNKGFNEYTGELIELSPFINLEDLSEEARAALAMEMEDGEGQGTTSFSDQLAIATHHSSELDGLFSDDEGDEDEGDEDEQDERYEPNFEGLWLD